MAKPSTKPKRRRWRAARWAAVAAVVCALVPAAQVACVRWINPPLTPEMVRFRWFSTDEAARKRGLRYEWVSLESVPRPFLHYLWASEDQRFFEHRGIDWDEIRQALHERADKPRGASTITQQCARSLFLWQGRSWLRKALEVYYTVWMEWLLPKRRIFELYVNVIEFGEGVYGVQAAAKAIYHRPPARLTREEMAMLVAVMPNPKEWNPRRPTSRLRARQQRVIRLAGRARFPAEKLTP